MAQAETHEDFDEQMNRLFGVKLPKLPFIVVGEDSEAAGSPLRAAGGSPAVQEREKIKRWLANISNDLWERIRHIDDDETVTILSRLLIKIDTAIQELHLLRMKK